MRRIFIFLGIAFLISCASMPKRPYSIQDGILSQQYKGSYDSVWSAVLKTLSKYSLTTSNKDAGLIKTDFLNGHSRTEFLYSVGMRLPKENKWKLELRFLSLKNLNTIQIKIEKEEFVNPGFLEQWRHTESDLLTEKAILYRIGRTVYLDKKTEN